MSTYGDYYRVRFRRARRTYYCQTEWAHATRVDPGDVYAEVTEYPGATAGYADTAGHPITWRQCRHCGERLVGEINKWRRVVSQ